MSRDRPARPPRWTIALLRRVAAPERAEEAVGDLEEAHRLRVGRHGPWLASLLTGLEALDVAFALRRDRRRSRTAARRATRREAGLRGPRRRIPPVSWLDVKLGIRMLVKHPGLSIVSALGMAVAVGIGACAFGVIHAMTASTLPFDEGERVVTIQNTGTFGLDQARSTHLHDLVTWREEVRAIEDLGAYRIITRNVVTTDGSIAPARIAEMTASGFRIARVPPLLGRYLVADDEREGAPEVVVIGHGVWQDRFGARPDVVGQTLQIGATRHTVVGVMPRGFAFPINNRIWTPLRLNPTAFEPGAAPPVDVFARLAPGASMDEAAAQLEVLGARAAAEHPETHEGLRARVFPYTQELVWGPMSWLLYIGQLLVSMLLVVIAVNVAALVYARTAMRAGEIAVRTALGASRGRIASQLFAEALVVCWVAAALGLYGARWALRQVGRMVASSGGEQVPFWWDFGLSSSSVLYGFGLAVLAAAIIGVVPALGLTGRRLRSGLQSIGSGGSAPRLGRTWTVLIVAQIAAAVAVLPVALSGVGTWLLAGPAEAAFPIDEFLTPRVYLDQETLPDVELARSEPDPGSRYVALLAEVVRRLEGDPQVSHVVVMAPAPWGDPDVRFELEGAPTPGSPAQLESAFTGQLVGRSRVGRNFFEAFEIPLLAGRAFDAGDVVPGSASVIVDQTFVRLVLGGGDPIGRRIRFVTCGDAGPQCTERAPWHTVIGVIPEFDHGAGQPEATAFQPMVPGGEDHRPSLAVRVRGGDPERFAGRLREIVASVDPMLRLDRVVPLDGIYKDALAITRFVVVAITALALSVFLLAAAGLYALMSFTVVRRHREIGIRTALGARPHRVLVGVLSRAMGQLALGTAVGVMLAGLADRALAGGLMGGRGALVLPVVAALMAAVGIIAAWGPARRGLSIQPTEALRTD